MSEHSPAAFHDVVFPRAVALGSRGGPERLTEIVTMGSGREVRNSRWALSRRRYDAGYGIKTLDALHEVLAFFEERRGRLYGFRWHDRLDHRSCRPGAAPTALDQRIGTGDGATLSFALVKTYGADHAPYARPITRPVAGTVRVAVAGVETTPAGVDHATGVVTFAPGAAPPPGASVTAGFRFDVPVRFDTDMLEIDLAAFEAGVIPKIPLVEIL